VAIRAPSFHAFFVPIWSKLTEEEFLAYAERLPLRKHFYRRMGRGGFSPVISPKRWRILIRRSHAWKLRSAAAPG